MLKLTITLLFMCEIRYQCLCIFSGERNLSGEERKYL